ncbi:MULTISPECIES: helix-turn-helix domain-containing protein [Kordiimonas]|uniref:helix-turn-helix domain-containing protein n=1 Tax=Kordiimonas TaxID=288021 RepID=UPI001FF68BB5|nr:MULTISPECIES: helix-turn-helix transcriptional regulator [Kordiimonas]MCK0068338.1 helix-turn-helix domain-containing protein [Kordiimonas laminariae]UTW59698.1 helix-turn-helix transcriptional regulator [Kordiimonas sp. SCSIO 12603]
MADPVDIAVGERIRQLRKERHITQTELGAAVGLTFQQIQKYEKAKNRISASKLVQIADIFNVDVSELFKGSMAYEDVPESEEIAELIKYTERMPDHVRSQFLNLMEAIAQAPETTSQVDLL